MFTCRGIFSCWAPCWTTRSRTLNLGRGVAGGPAAGRESAAPVVFTGSAGVCHDAVLWPADAAGLRTGSGVPQAVGGGGLFYFRTGRDRAAQDGDHLPGDLRAVAWLEVWREKGRLRDLAAHVVTLG